ncbi:hypothetical protein BJ165DRAFT_914992 [Panaeolus papilionaceus]|nr:hypothetical protein BJ165DRAFT_914992 [Panaeolus papilionaceus]
MSEFLEIIVDNTSPALHYEGEWTSSRHDRALSGAPLTVPEGKKGSFFYNITGVTRVFVQGLREDFSPDSDTSFNLHCEVTPNDPTIVYRSFVATADWATELFYIFEVRNLLPTTSYTLNVTLESLRAPVVWFDALLLAPTATTNLDDAIVKMDHNHPMIQYDTKWESQIHGNTLHSTNTSGSTMQLDYNGTSLKWYTNWFFVIGIGNITSEATWKVDDMEGTFIVPIPDPADGFSNFRQLLFETPELPPGLHHLEVTYHGNTSTRPLSLRDLVIHSAYAASSSSSPTMSPDGATQGTPNSDAAIPQGIFQRAQKLQSALALQLRQL